MKRFVTTALQVLVSAGLLWWIFHDPTKRAQMGAALAAANWLWFLPGLVCIGLVLALQTQRWTWLLRAVDIHLPWTRALRLNLIGMFFNLFLLGATGGDVVRIYYAMREARGDKAGAFLSIALERVIGLLALAFVSAVVVAIQWPELMRSPAARVSVLTIGLILGASVAVVVAGATVAALRLEHRLPARMPLRRAIIDLAAATQRYAQAPGALVAAFLISIPSHLLLFATFYFAARALSAGLSLVDIVTVMPIVNVITSLPISLGGVGFREQLFQSLLGSLHATPAALAVLIGSCGYLMMVVWSVVGGVVYIFYRPSDGAAASLSEMTAATEKIAADPTP